MSTDIKWPPPLPEDSLCCNCGLVMDKPGFTPTSAVIYDELPGWQCRRCAQKHMLALGYTHPELRKMDKVDKSLGGTLALAVHSGVEKFGISGGS